MFRPRVIPILLLKDNGLVKTINFKNPRYIGDPMNAIKIYNDFEADELVFLDIESSKNNKTISLDFVKKVSEEAFMPFAVGGGVRNIEQIKEIFNFGAEKVVLNSYAVENPDLVKEASKICGSQSIIFSMDCKKEVENYAVYIESASRKVNIDPVSLALKMEYLGAGEILVNSINKEGTMEGYDLELIKKISDAVKIPVIASGGAGGLEDFDKAVKIGGASAVAAGSLFVYSGKNRGILINYPDKKELQSIFVSNCLIQK